MSADLAASYRACRAVTARHGRTFHLATLLLPPEKRPAIHALYAFARCADDIVDHPGTASPDEVAARLASWGDGLGDDLRRGDSDHPVRRAVVDTVHRWGVAEPLFDEFLAAMRADLTVSEYATYDDLLAYMAGSAAAIGLQTLPVLEPLDPAAAEAYARDLGIGFQLANFVRDVGEDLRRGRVYLPQEDLALFGVDRAHLERGVVDGKVRRLLAFEVARTREVLRSAEPGIRLLHPTSRPCVETALRLYGGILDAVVAADYRVLDRRVAVGLPTRAAVAGRGLLRARRARATARPD